MGSTGKRHAYRNDWEVGFDDDGRILALETNFHSDGGASTDLVAGGDGADDAPRRQLLLHSGHRNQRPGLLHELSVEHGLSRLRRPAGDRRRWKTSFTKSPSTWASMRSKFSGAICTGRRAKPHAVLPGRSPRITCPKLSTTLAASLGLRRRRAAIEAANQTDRLRLRGIALSPVKFGISFTTRLLEPGQRAGQRLHRRHGAGVDRRHRDGPGPQHEDSPARGR